jgi:sulfonate transport system substrate-binding protein
VQRRGLGGLMFVFLCVAPSIAWGADPLKIQFGFQAPPDKILPMLAHRTDITPHAGVSYEVVPLRFMASTEEVTALATGDLDIANLAYSSLAIAIENARMDDVRMVAESFRDGVPGYFTDEFRVGSDRKIQRIEDLRGKVLTGGGVGTATDMALRYLLRRHGLEDKKDYTSVEVSLPNFAPMLLEGKVDLAPILASYAQDANLNARTRTLFTQRDAFGVTQLSIFVARKGWLDRNASMLADFFEDLVRASRWLLDPANREGAIQLVSAYTKQSPALLSTYFLTPRDNFRDPDARPDLTATQNNLNAMQELGFLKTNIDVSKYTDLSFIDAAVKRLNK